MPKLILFFCFSFLLALSCYSQPVYTDKRTDVIVSFVPSEDMFPESWYENDDPYYVSLPRGDYERTRDIVSKALSKYPTYIIKNNLKKIYVLYDLSFEDVHYGGTYYQNTLFIINEGLPNGYDDLFVEQTFHHEFSSILYNNYVAYFAESETAFCGCNEEDAEYGDGGFEAIKNGENSLDFDEDINEMGYICQYGMSDKENDFNTLVENMFAPTYGFWDVVAQYPRIKCKVDLLLKLYRMLDPVFTEEFFRRQTKMDY